MSLSDKIHTQKWINWCCPYPENNKGFLLRKDVKEFIKQLKKEIGYYKNHKEEDIIKLIDKLVGAEFVQKASEVEK